MSWDTYKRMCLCFFILGCFFLFTGVIYSLNPDEGMRALPCIIAGFAFAILGEVGMRQVPKNLMR